MSSDPQLRPLEKALLVRINEARAHHLVSTGHDLLWADLMRAMDWSQTTTSQVKNGKRVVQLDELPALARALGVRVEWLAFGSGPMRDGMPGAEADFHEAQAQRYPPARQKPAPARKGRRAG